MAKNRQLIWIDVICLTSYDSAKNYTGYTMRMFELLTICLVCSGPIYGADEPSQNREILYNDRQMQLFLLNRIDESHHFLWENQPANLKIADIHYLLGAIAAYEDTFNYSLSGVYAMPRWQKNNE